ncbi:MucBP domain-containing protein [Paenibacillus thiaminolyticus]|uniref:MucBP domain-containing protein n=1 Tax=Paenibacillus thiaminolyticus TaxID=49283 RepID=UPI0035A66F79
MEGSKDKIVLQSYVMSGTVGETVSATAPDILGWRLTTAATQEATVGTDKEMIFRYAKDVVTVTVKAADAQGATLDEQSFQAPRGGSFTAYAPHVSGYVLDDDQTKELSNITADASVTFRYKSIEEVVPEHTVTITVIGQSAYQPRLTAHYPFGAGRRIEYVSAAPYGSLSLRRRKANRIRICRALRSLSLRRRKANRIRISRALRSLSLRHRKLCQVRICTVLCPVTS